MSLFDYREGLKLLPEHMHEAVTDWIERGLPDPTRMGSFFRAVLSNSLVEAFGKADWQNARVMHGWAGFLYNYAPSDCWGEPGKLWAWHLDHHPDPNLGSKTLTASEEGALVSSVRIDTNRSPHARLTVWTNGGNSGSLVVDAKNAEALARRLLGQL